MGFFSFILLAQPSAAQAAYPPFGLASVSFTGLSCYLIYSGLYSSALRYPKTSPCATQLGVCNRQSKLLDSIGTAQMEQELQSRILTVTKKLSDKMEEETGVEASMTEEDIKEHIEMVRKEIHRS